MSTAAHDRRVLLSSTATRDAYSENVPWIIAKTHLVKLMLSFLTAKLLISSAKASLNFGTTIIRMVNQRRAEFPKKQLIIRRSNCNFDRRSRICTHHVCICDKNKHYYKLKLRVTCFIFFIRYTFQDFNSCINISACGLSLEWRGFPASRQWCPDPPFGPENSDN